MTEPHDHWRGVLEDTHEAVTKYAAIELATLARKAIYQLRRLSASGLYEGHRFKTVWDEYCHTVHRDNGPSYEWIWNETINSFVDYDIDLLPRHVGLLLSVGADYERGRFEDMTVSYQPDVIRNAVRERIDDAARDRDMRRFDRS